MMKKHRLDCGRELSLVPLSIPGPELSLIPSSNPGPELSLVPSSDPGPEAVQRVEEIELSRTLVCIAIDSLICQINGR